MYFNVELIVISLYFLTPTIITVVDAKCDNPPEIDNGYVDSPDLKDSYETGDKVKYVCSFGHHLDSSSDRATSECLQNGVWAAPGFNCLPILCPRLENPQNGRIVGSGVAFGEHATFECFSGYYQWSRFNNMERVCMNDGKWNGEEFECRPVKCPDLKDIENGQVSQKTGVYKTEVKYSCLSGFRLLGDRTRKCLQNGTWSSTEPGCIGASADGSCPSPFSKEFLEKFPYLAKTQVPVGIKPGHRVTFICASDADLKIVSTCSRNGEWRPSPSESFCNVATSSAPGTTASTATETNEVSTTVPPTESIVLHEDSTLDPVQGEELTTESPVTVTPTGDGDKTENPEATTGLPVWVYVVIPVSLITIVVVVVTAFFLKKKSRQNGPLKHIKDKTDAEMESLANNRAHL